MKELKEICKFKMPSLEKQMNLANGLLDEKEAQELKGTMKNSLLEYEKKKAAIHSATSYEQAHYVIHNEQVFN